MDWLSGDQNGDAAPSVPARRTAATASRGRSHKDRWPSATATKATDVPSGATARKWFSSSVVTQTPGGTTVNRMGETGAGPAISLTGFINAATRRAAAAPSPRIIQAVGRGREVRAGTAETDIVPPIAWSAKAMSFAD